MNNKIGKLSSVTLTLIIVLSSVMAFYSVSAQPKPSIFVDPHLNQFFTNQTDVGDTFTITVKTADWVDPGVFGYEFKVTYDNTMLEATVAEIPDGHWLTPTIKPTNFFPVDSGTIDQAAGTVSFAAALLAPELGKTGGGTLVTVTFEIIAAPPVNGILTCPIGLSGVILVDPSATPVPTANYDVVPATYIYQTPPLAKPTLSVSSWAWDKSAADAAGRLFNITVSIDNLLADWHVIGIQFRLHFDTTLMSTDKDNVFEGPFMKQFGETFFTAFVEGDVIGGNLQLPPYPGSNGWASGSGVIATIQFHATYDPPPEVIDSPLTLNDVQIVDEFANIVEYAGLQGGTYTITLAPPAWLSAVPATATLNPSKGTGSFDLNIQINNLDAGFQMVGAEFKVFYDTAILSTTEDQISEGLDNVLREAADRMGTDLFFQAYVEEDHGLIGIILLPLPDGTWSFFPEGTGGLATVTFTALQQLADAELITEIHVGDVILVNPGAKTIPTDEAKTAVEGICVVTIEKAVIGITVPPHPMYPYSIDLYTQYDVPYGGQGYNQVSDAFPYQADVQLKAKTTYNGEAVSGKPVVYTIVDPKGNVYSGVAMTGPDGVADFDFIMPWQATAGLWGATATWQVGSQVITDTIAFRVGDLVTVSDIEVQGSTETTADGLPVFYKAPNNGHYNVLLTLKEITMQSPVKCMDTMIPGSDGWTTVTILDELGQPVGYVAANPPELQEINVPFDEANQAASFKKLNDYVLGGNFTLREVGPMPITIGSNAFTGKASVQANVLTKLFDGVPYGAPTVEYIWIKAKTTGVPLTPVSDAELVVMVNKLTANIVIRNVDPAEHITALQFYVEYDPTVVEPTAVTEGPFIKQFGETFFQYYIETDTVGKHVLVGTIQLPPYPGENGWMSGSGTLATITFERIPAPSWISTKLTLNPTETMLANADGFQYNFAKLVNGFMIVTG